MMSHQEASRMNLESHSQCDPWVEDRGSGIRGPGGRAEDSRSEGPGFKTRNWANFQSCGETLK